jgi:hypothetical protein
MYRPQIERLSIPSGSFIPRQNNLFLAEDSDKTHQMLGFKKDGKALRGPDDTQMACFIDRNATVDIFPTIMGALDRLNRSELTC